MLNNCKNKITQTINEEDGIPTRSTDPQIILLTPLLNLLF